MTYTPTNHDHEYKCEQCGKLYETRPNDLSSDSRFCSPICREEYYWDLRRNDDYEGKVK